MKKQNLAFLSSVLYLSAALFVIYTNASSDISKMLTGKFLIFSMLSILVFIVLLLVIKESNNNDE